MTGWINESAAIGIGVPCAEGIADADCGPNTIPPADVNPATMRLVNVLFNIDFLSIIFLHVRYQS